MKIPAYMRTWKVVMYKFLLLLAMRFSVVSFEKGLSISDFNVSNNDKLPTSRSKLHGIMSDLSRLMSNLFLNMYMLLHKILSEA